jgi:hypothetical protein
MNLPSRVVGLVLLCFLLWDLNAYYFHVPWPPSFFWDFTLPFALVFYVVVGFSLLLGVVEVRRK